MKFNTQPTGEEQSLLGNNNPAMKKEGHVLVALMIIGLAITLFVAGCASVGSIADSGEGFVLNWPLHDLGSTPTQLPLEECQGDCDRSSDCRGDLVCYQRDGYDDVPWCTGEGVKDHDYCVLPVYSFGVPILDWVGSSSPDGSPLKVCQGDCDLSSECAGDLVCYQRDGYDEIPGCFGKGVKDHDYCVHSVPKCTIPSLCVPTHDVLPVLDWVGSSSPDGSPLKVCQGDCDLSSECAGDLVCYQRDGYDAIPGCRGKGVKDHDYCVHPVHEGFSSPDGSLLEVCQGHCDSDAECKEGLICIERSGYDAIPGCFGKSVENQKICVYPFPRCAVPTLLDVEGLEGYFCPDLTAPLKSRYAANYGEDICNDFKNGQFGSIKPFYVRYGVTQICSDGKSPPCKAPAPINLSGNVNGEVCHDGNLPGRGSRCSDGKGYIMVPKVCPDGEIINALQAMRLCNGGVTPMKPLMICPDGSMPE